jgi:hypothetical protein
MRLSGFVHIEKCKHVIVEFDIIHGLMLGKVDLESAQEALCFALGPISLGASSISSQ